MHRLWILVGLAACGSGNETAARQAPVQTEPTKACTQIGCGPAFELRFKKQTPWAKGMYRIEVAFDNAPPTTCKIAFPLDCDVEQQCEGPNSGDFHIGESGCALPPEGQELMGVAVNQGVAPAVLSVAVFQKGKQLASQTYALQYIQGFPNGPDCGPTCTSAPSADLSLP